MTPFQTARELHRSDPDNEPFEEVLTAHLLAGVVVSTAEAFVLMRPVLTDFPKITFDDPWISFPFPDCWHVYLAAGSLPAILAAIPYPLEFVSFVRKNRLHIQQLKHMTERIERHGRQTKREAGGPTEEGQRNRSGDKTCHSEG